MEIPIVFLDRSGKPTADQIRGHPCIQVALIEYGTGEVPTIIDAALHWALIDTGADFVYADPTVLAEIGAKTWGTADVNGGPNSTPVHRCHVLFPSIRLATQQAVIQRDFRSLGDPYSIALGRMALEDFELTFNSKTGRASKLVKID